MRWDHVCMNAETQAMLSQFSQLVAAFRDQMARENTLQAEVAVTQCEQILDDMAYLKPRAVFHALSLREPNIHNLAIHIIASLLTTSDRLQQTMLIQQLMLIPPDRYLPQLAVNLGKPAPSQFISSVSMNTTIRALSFLSAHRFLRALSRSNPPNP